jgi:hypothetical protein
VVGQIHRAAFGEAVKAEKRIKEWWRGGQSEMVDFVRTFSVILPFIGEWTGHMAISPLYMEELLLRETRWKSCRLLGESV